MACAYCKLPGHNSSTCPDPTGSQPTANNPVIEQYLPQLDDGPEQDGNWLSASGRAWHINNNIPFGCEQYPVSCQCDACLARAAAMRLRPQTVYD